LRITLFESCSAFTHVAARTLAKSPKVTLYTGELFSLILLFDCSDCFRLERQCAGWVFHPRGSPCLSTAHPKSMSMALASTLPVERAEMTPAAPSTTVPA
jgi:hypothetical protein